MSGGRASEQEHWEGSGVPSPGHHLGDIFAFPFLILLMRKTNKHPQRSCGEREMPESESTQARHSSLQPVALVRPRCALHRQLQHGN